MISTEPQIGCFKKLTLFCCYSLIFFCYPSFVKRTEWLMCAGHTGESGWFHRSVGLTHPSPFGVGLAMTWAGCESHLSDTQVTWWPTHSSPRAPWWEKQTATLLWYPPARHAPYTSIFPRWFWVTLMWNTSLRSWLFTVMARHFSCLVGLWSSGTCNTF